MNFTALRHWGRSLEFLIKSVHFTKSFALFAPGSLRLLGSQIAYTVLLVSLIGTTGCAPESSGTTTVGFPEVNKLEVTDFAAVQTAVLTPFRCLNCHTDSSPRGGVSLESYRVIMSSSGLVVPGNPEASRLYQSVASGRMPPRAKVDEASLAILRKWIEDGANETSTKTVSLFE